MNSALIVSCKEDLIAFFTGLLGASGITQIAALPSCARARRLLLEQDFDLVIVNTPLRDEPGDSFARHIAAKGVSQVILISKSEPIGTKDGLQIIASTTDKAPFLSALTMAKTMHSQGKKAKKTTDTRIIDRAKHTLMSLMNMSEQEAHKFIEKQAMDIRTTRRAIAEGILKTYEN